MPATIVGSANGMSMTISSTREPRNGSRTSTQATSVPMTALTTATASDSASVSRSAAAASRVGDRRPEVRPAAAERLADHRGERQQDEQAEPEDDHAEARARTPGRSGRPAAGAAPRTAAPARCRRRRRGGPVELAGSRRTRSILVTMPVLSPKNLSLTAFQPPSCAIVTSFFGVRERVARVVGALDRRDFVPASDRAEALAGEDLLALLALDEGQELLGRLTARSWSPPPGSRSGWSGPGRCSRRAAPFCRAAIASFS